MAQSMKASRYISARSNSRKARPPESDQRAETSVQAANSASSAITATEMPLSPANGRSCQRHPQDQRQCSTALASEKVSGK